MPDNLPKEYDHRVVEDTISQFWERHDYFRTMESVTKKSYFMILPPLNIADIFNMDEAINTVLQDILARFKRMRAFDVFWIPGTDHSGVNAQNFVSNWLCKHGIDKEELGRDRFLQQMWNWSRRYNGLLIKQLRKLGCSCDWSKSRFTMDEELATAVKSTFIKLYHEGFIYKGDYIVNWCSKCHTILADNEIVYYDVKDELYYISYPVSNPGDLEGEGTIADDYVTIATARPELIFGDVAVAVHPKDERHKGLRDIMLRVPIVDRAIPVIVDKDVKRAFGTGILKLAPAHDAKDFSISQRHGLSPINVLDENGRLNQLCGKYSGFSKLKAREAIIKYLDKNKLLVKSDRYTHSVAHCKRCRTQIEPKLSKQWFVRMKILAKKAYEEIERGRMNFYPSKWDKVLLEYIRGIRDWCISRQIWWGHRIPAYYCKKCSKSANESNKVAGRKDGLHDFASRIIVSSDRPKVCPLCASPEVIQDPDVFDTSFSLWLWPFVVLGWPKETEDKKRFFPVNILIASRNVIFFWVLRMIVGSLKLTGRRPFKDIYVQEIGSNLRSKKNRNMPSGTQDPMEMVQRYGADVLRFSLLTMRSGVDSGSLSKSKLAYGSRFVQKLLNGSRFVLDLIAELDLSDNMEITNEELKKMPFAEKWILNCMNRTVDTLLKYLDGYRFIEASTAIYVFFRDDFCNRYLEMAKLTLNSYLTKKVSYVVLERSLKALHPFMPFVTEHIWQMIPHRGVSLVVAEWPTFRKEYYFKDIDIDMAVVFDLIEALRKVRARQGISFVNALKLSVKVFSERYRIIMEGYFEYVKKVCNVSEIEFVEECSDPYKCAVEVYYSFEVYVHMEERINLEQEIGQLNLKLSRVKKETDRLEKILSDDAFKRKAPEPVIISTREKLGVKSNHLRRIYECIQRYINKV